MNEKLLRYSYEHGFDVKKALAQALIKYVTSGGLYNPSIPSKGGPLGGTQDLSLGEQILYCGFTTHTPLPTQLGRAWAILSFGTMLFYKWS